MFEAERGAFLHLCLKIKRSVVMIVNQTDTETPGPMSVLFWGVKQF